MRGQRGYGLVETLIALGLGALLLTMLHRFLVPVLLASSKNSTQVHLSQQANLVLTRFEQDLKESDGAGLSYLEATDPGEPVAIALCRRAGLTPEGVKLYQGNARIYTFLPTSRQIYFREMKLGEAPLPSSHNPITPIRLSPEELFDLAADTTKSKILSGSVTNFQPIDQWPVQNGVMFSLNLEQATGGTDKQARYSIDKRISFR